MSRYSDEAHYIYEIKFPDGMRYIGYTYNIEQRIRTHATNPNKPIKKYLHNSGYSLLDAELSVLEITDTKKEGHAIEKKYLSIFYEKELLVNNYTPKKERKKFKVKMPNDNHEHFGIIEKNIYKPELKEAGNDRATNGSNNDGKCSTTNG